MAIGYKFPLLRHAWLEFSVSYVLLVSCNFLVLFLYFLFLALTIFHLQIKAQPSFGGGIIPWAHSRLCIYVDIWRCVAIGRKSQSFLIDRVSSISLLLIFAGDQRCGGLHKLEPNNAKDAFSVDVFGVHGGLRLESA